MKKSTFENLNIESSLLGFGCMRFPTLENGEIDEVISEQMLDYAYQNGVTYFDTAYPYHNGKSEEFTGRILDKYERSSYLLATKLPCWEVNSVDDAKRIFDIQLKRLNKDYIDFYMLHALDIGRFDYMVSLGVVDFLKELKASGKIRFFGFSFHDSYEAYKKIIHFCKWDFCQLQLNYMDTDYQQGIQGYLDAKNLGIPVIVMEPVKGGSLSNVPDEIGSGFEASNPGASPSSWAFRWCGSLDNVKVILSGMSTIEQVKDNIKTFKNFKELSEKDSDVIKKAGELFRARVNNGCTSCNYCMPCPAGVNIPYNFKQWNNYGIYKNVPQSRFAWQNETSEGERAKNCSECGACEEACPQKISIREDLKRVQLELDSICK